VAFALGVDETGLLQADEAAGGALLPLVTSATRLPEVHIHAGLTADAVRERAAMRSERFLGRLAEMGLIRRPIHLWIGSSVLTDCVSPYTRDLRQALSRWAESNPLLLGDDLGSSAIPPGEDLSYALAHDFLRTDQNLGRERAEANRQVGIQRYEDDGVELEVIDLGRLDPGVVDARLSFRELDSPAPVILRIDLDLEDDEAAGLKSLLVPLAPQIRSVSVLLDGTALSGEIGAIILPHLLVDWAGEEKLTIPGAVPLSPEEIVSVADAVVREGAVLAAPSASLINPDAVMELLRTFGVQAVTIGNAGIIRALADACFCGLLSSEVQISWALVSTHFASTGRPTLKTLGAQAAVAVATLRRWLSDREPTPRQALEPPQDRPRPRSGRAVRIKA